MATGCKKHRAHWIKIMRRYWIEKSQIQDSIINFKGDLFHHIFDVCRQEIGHHFEVITEDSKAYLVEVVSIEKKSASAKIIEFRDIEKLPLPHIHIALSISRYPVMDAIVEKAVELGVTSILPFTSEYSFIRSAQNLPTGKTERWQKIVVSATQQSGRGELLKIYPPTSWPEMLKIINPGPENLCLFAYEGESTADIQTFLKTKKESVQKNLNDLWVLVGSEGGFSTREVQQLSSLGLNPVTLGSQVLRVETACLTLVAILKYEFGLMK